MMNLTKIALVLICSITFLSLKFPEPENEQMEGFKLLFKESIGATMFFPQPVFSADHIFIGNDEGIMTCRDNKKARVIWSFKAGDAIYNEPLLVGRSLFFSSKDGKIYALYATNGQEKWNFDAGSPLNSKITNFANMVYCYSRTQFFALDQETGLDMWKINMKISGRPEVFYNNGKLYFADDMKVYCLDAKNGETIWTYEIPSFGHSDISLAENSIFFSSANKIYCLHLDSGKKKWIFDSQIPDKLKNNNKVLVKDGKAYASIKDKIFVLETTKGEEIFNTKIKTSFELKTIQIVDDAILVCDGGNMIYALKTDKGKKIAVYEHNCPITSPALTIWNNTIYFIDQESNICAVKII